MSFSGRSAPVELGKVFSDGYELLRADNNDKMYDVCVCKSGEYRIMSKISLINTRHPTSRRQHATIEDILHLCPKHQVKMPIEHAIRRRSFPCLMKRPLRFCTHWQSIYTKVVRRPKRTSARGLPDIQSNVMLQMPATGEVTTSSGDLWSQPPADTASSREKSSHRARNRMTLSRRQPRKAVTGYDTCARRYFLLFDAKVFAER